jgi:hydroxymethylbilane synthase
MERVLGTRGSALALWQARHVKGRLEELHSGLDVRIEIIKTEGDLRVDVPFGELPGKGFFVKEIEAALLSGAIDLAVHSLKDMPSELPDNLALAAVLERHDPRDAVLSVAGWAFDEIPEGTILATGSPRRRCQLLHARPDLTTTEVRGNVDTRIRKLREGQFGALILALAGVQRLGIDSVPMRPIPTHVSLPAVGQGAVTVETREDDAVTRELVEGLIHRSTLRAVTAERAYLAQLEGGCLAPATAFGHLEDDTLVLEAVVGEPDGRRMLRERGEAAAGGERELGEALASRMLQAGAGEILSEAREQSGERG